MDAFKLVSAWSGGSVTTSSQSTVTMTLVANVNALAATQVAYLVATVTSSDGITPTGSVAFSIDGSSLGSAVLSGSAGTATGTLSITGSQLPSTGGTITASYGGDTASSSGTASVTLTVCSTPAISSIPAINGLTNGASFKSTFAPGMIMSLFGSLLAPSTLEASSTPLPVSMAGVGATVNGVAAPFYYVSPTQINLQIPYEVATGTATLNINNNGQVTSQSFTVTDTAPGIFINESSQPVPSTTATRGQIVTLYITGAGRVSPAVATGAAPAAGTATADLPQPTHSVSMTVGGVEATIEFIGIPSAIVGAVQINYLVPSGIATGAQPVIVTANGVASSPAYLSITN